MERIEQLTVKTYLEKLSSSRMPGPASGSAMATVAAMAAALVEMSYKVTTKKGVDLPVDLEKIKEVREQCMDLATEDVKALAKVIEEGKSKEENPQRYEIAMEDATDTLVSMAKHCEFILEKIEQVIPQCDKRVLAELVGAANMAEAAGKSAILGVEANMSLLKDKQYKEDVQDQIETLSESCAQMTERIMNFM